MGCAVEVSKLREVYVHRGELIAHLYRLQTFLLGYRRFDPFHHRHVYHARNFLIVTCELVVGYRFGPESWRQNLARARTARGRRIEENIGSGIQLNGAVRQNVRFSQDVDRTTAQTVRGNSRAGCSRIYDCCGNPGPHMELTCGVVLAALNRAVNRHIPRRVRPDRVFGEYVTRHINRTISPHMHASCGRNFGIGQSALRQLLRLDQDVSVGNHIDTRPSAPSLDQRPFDKVQVLTGNVDQI